MAADALLARQRFEGRQMIQGAFSRVGVRDLLIGGLLVSIGLMIPALGPGKDKTRGCGAIVA
jgi:hypothetical protein